MTVPDAPLPLVSAEDYVAAVASYADRAHDLARRAGCAPPAASEVVETAALDLLEALAARPETVGEIAGWLLGRTAALAARVGSHPGFDADPGAAARGVLASGPDQLRLAAAVASLAAPERLAVLLRDGYDLPFTAVAVALGRSPAAATALVARGRERLAASYAGAAGAGPDAGWRLAAALPVVALPDDERDGMLARVGERAAGVLPSPEEVLLAVEVARGRPVLAPGLVAAVILLAVLGGVLTAALTFGGGGMRTVELTPSPPPMLVPTSAAGPGGGSPSASTTPSASATPSTPGSPTRPAPADTPSPTAPPAAARPPSPSPAVAALTLDPTSGPNGTLVRVGGSGFTPGASVEVSYRGTLGQPTGSQTSALVGPDGTFTATLRASDPTGLPGRHGVVANDGERSASATFTATA